MRALVVAAAIMGLLLAVGSPAGAESSSAPGKAKIAKPEIAKKKAKKKPVTTMRKAYGGKRGGGGMAGSFGARPPGSSTETDPPDRRGSPDPVREPSPLGTRD